MAEAEQGQPDHTIEGQEQSVVSAGGDVSDAGKTMKTSIVADGAFKDLMLKPEILKAIEERGLEHPTEVQCKCIPAIIDGKDILCEAGSGVGKTTAIVLATLQNFTPEDGKISMIVMSHSRKKADQIAKDFTHFSKHLFSSPLKVAVFCGGHSIRNDKKQLKNNCPHIVVGTLGRTIMLLRHKVLNLKDVTQFVIHECGPLLEQSATQNTKQELEEIYRNTAHEKQILLFSSRLVERVRPLCRWFFKLKEPLEITLGDKQDTEVTKGTPEDKDPQTNRVNATNEEQHT